MQRDQHAWMLEQLRALDDATRERVERLTPRLRTAVRSRSRGRDQPTDLDEKTSYAILALMLSLQRHPEHPDRKHIGAAVRAGGQYIRDEARAWGVNAYQLRHSRRTDWRPLSLEGDTRSIRRIEDIGGVDPDEEQEVE